ncbi:hypothetical protein KY092_15780 [Natronomonas gomsonensis]|uniref:hypothetical protein n=1 Tax=Natronomonas gomsonensis TaxID=1046043 RepID=UPI0020CA7098|nr:hypothetical protein [Natronomonas gomsonensis]MCY4732022.1 hypothetical protein [Natronomonas gomsonensis]
MRAKSILLAVLAASALLVGAVGAAAAQPDSNDSDAGERGPPSDLPGPVPDFVGDILGSVNDFLTGGISDLGEAVSGIASGE